MSFSRTSVKQIGKFRLWEQCLSTKPIGNKYNKARRTGTKMKQLQNYSHNDFSLRNIQMNDGKCDSEPWWTYIENLRRKKKKLWLKTLVSSGASLTSWGEGAS